MHAQDMAIVKSLVTVAWADGKIASEESEVIEGLLQAYEATPTEAEMVREYAREPKGLDDLPLTDLSADDRRVLLQHAVFMTLADGVQDASETQLLIDLAGRLRILERERSALINTATERAKRFLGLL